MIDPRQLQIIARTDIEIVRPPGKRYAELETLMDDLIQNGEFSKTDENGTLVLTAVRDNPALVQCYYWTPEWVGTAQAAVIPRANAYVR